MSISELRSLGKFVSSFVVLVERSRLVEGRPSVRCAKSAQLRARADQKVR